MERFELPGTSVAICEADNRDHAQRKSLRHDRDGGRTRDRQSGSHLHNDPHVRTHSLSLTSFLKCPASTIYPPRFLIPMPSPSPGANTPSSSGNGTPKLLNDYVLFQSLFLSGFAHGGCLSNSAIVSGKAHLARSIVRSHNFSPSPAVSSLALRCPQLGHGGDCGRKGDHVSQYTEGRDIPNNGG